MTPPQKAEQHVGISVTRVVRKIRTQTWAICQFAATIRRLAFGLMIMGAQKILILVLTHVGLRLGASKMMTIAGNSARLVARRMPPSAI